MKNLDNETKLNLEFTPAQLEKIRLTRAEMDKVKTGYNRYNDFERPDLELTDEQVGQIYALCKFALSKFKFIGEDEMQEVVTKITTRSLYSYDPQYKASTFIVTCAKNEALHIYQTKNRKKNSMVFESLDKQIVATDNKDTKLSMIKDKSYKTHEKQEYINFLSENVKSFPILNSKFNQKMSLKQIGENAKSILKRDTNLSLERVRQLETKELNELRKLCLKQGYNHDMLNNDLTK